MKSLKKVGVAALVAALAVTAAAFVACTDPAEEGPQTVEAEQISSCKVEYNWGEVFDGADLAYEVTSPTALPTTLSTASPSRAKTARPSPTPSAAAIPK